LSKRTSGIGVRSLEEVGIDLGEVSHRPFLQQVDPLLGRHPLKLLDGHAATLSHSPTLPLPRCRGPGRPSRSAAEIDCSFGDSGFDAVEVFLLNLGAEALELSLGGLDVGPELAGFGFTDGDPVLGGGFGDGGQLGQCLGCGPTLTS